LARGAFLRWNVGVVPGGAHLNCLVELSHRRRSCYRRVVGSQTRRLALEAIEVARHSRGQPNPAADLTSGVDHTSSESALCAQEGKAGMSRVVRKQFAGAAIGVIVAAAVVVLTLGSLGSSNSKTLGAALIVHSTT